VRQRNDALQTADGASAETNAISGTTTSCPYKPTLKRPRRAPRSHERGDFFFFSPPRSPARCMRAEIPCHLGENRRRAHGLRPVQHPRTRAPRRATTAASTMIAEAAIAPCRARLDCSADANPASSGLSECRPPLAREPPSAPPRPRAADAAGQGSGHLPSARVASAISGSPQHDQARRDRGQLTATTEHGLHAVDDVLAGSGVDRPPPCEPVCGREHRAEHGPRPRPRPRRPRKKPVAAVATPSWRALRTVLHGDDITG